jgi:DNA-binding GntR family transcriptional regulator
VSLGPPIKKQPLQKVVYARLREAILTSALEPGCQIKIGELAEGLNVSAVPVREALRQLEAEGMVRFQANRRVVVNDISEADLRDIYSILIPLEQIALEKCLKYLEPSSLKAIKAFHRKMSYPEIAGLDWIELNWLFHHKICELTRSPRLMQMVGSLRTSIRPYFRLVVRDKERIVQANEEHEQLLDALETGDLAEGKRVLRRHLKNGCKAIEHLLRQESKAKSAGFSAKTVLEHQASV